MSTWLADGAVGPFMDEVDKFHGQRFSGKVRSCSLQTILEQTFSLKDGLVGCAYFVEVLFAEAAPLEAHYVQSRQLGVISDYGTKRNYVFNDDCAAADKCVSADATELMDGRQPAEPNIVAYLYMASERDIVGHNHIVPDTAVMSDVGADHDIASVAHTCQAAVLGHTGMSGRILSENTTTPNFQAGVRRFSQAQDLRPAPQNGVRVEYAVFANLGLPYD